jgi:hypothetical protein
MLRAALLAGGIVVALAIAWALRPAPAGACVCRLPVLSSNLERVDGSTAAPAMCLVTDLGSSALMPCDANAVFDDEIFRSPQ